MAINKVINKSTKSHAAMKNVLKYVCRDDKVKEGYAFISGPYIGDSIKYDDIYQCWIKEKQLWDKDSGRMYAHNIISFHKDEKVSPAEVLEIGKGYAERFFPVHQYVITVHQDKDHLHCHIVTNTVSFIDGHKLHQSKHELEQQKEFTNNLCLERGLTVAEKGMHFDGTAFEQGDVTAWSKNKYNLLLNVTKKSFIAECAIAIMEVVPKSASREEFISGMEERGWTVQWEDKRKHIVFKNENGDKVRDSNLEKTISGLKVNKEVLTYEFERENERRLAEFNADGDRERDEANNKQYCTELEPTARSAETAKSVRRNKKTHTHNRDNVLSALPENIRTDASEEIWKTGRHTEDTAALVRDIRAEISNNRAQNRTIRHAESRSRADEREQQLKGQQQISDERAAEQDTGGYIDLGK